MSLGKRYIAIVKHPTMPHWNDYPAPELYKNAQAAALVAVNSGERRCGCDNDHLVDVHEVDIDDAVPADASLDEQHQHAERMATKWLARYQELSAEVGRVPGTCEPVDAALTLEDLEALREVRKMLQKYWDTPTRWYTAIEKAIVMVTR